MTQDLGQWRNGVEPIRVAGLSASRMTADRGGRIMSRAETHGAMAATKRNRRSASISRRRFLQGIVGGAFAATGAPAFARGQSGPGDLAVTPRNILVLGAGMSGLTAALALHQRGHDVTILEYQNRVGGRVLSVQLPDGQVSEAGAGHFRSNMPLALSYVRWFDLPIVSLNDGLPRYLVDGETANAANLADWPWPLTESERGVSVSSNLNRYLFLNGLNTNEVLDPAWPDQATMERFNDITLRDLVAQVGASDAFISLLDAHGGTFTSQSTALFALPDLAYHFGDQNLFRIRGGNEQLPQAMAELLGDRIVLDAPVTAIDQTGPRVKVTVRGGREFFGDAIISTIPFTIIPEIDVRPAWSAGKERMFQEMSWSNTVKVIVQTRTPSWLDHGVHGWPMAGGDRSWERVIDITGDEPGGRGNAFFYLNGKNAANVLARPREVRALETVEAFQADMPDLLDEVLHIEDFAWSEQPWIRASFGEPSDGGGWMIAEWTRPEGRIHFAGDFTSLKSGWIEGAIESGLRAARQIDPAAPSAGRQEPDAE